VAKDSVRDFLTRFVQPLVAGGEVHVGAPIPATTVDEWLTQLPAASVETNAVDDARTTVLATLVVRPPPVLFEDEDLQLAIGLHNALFLVHPRLDAWTVRDKQRRRIIDTALAQVSQPLSRQRARVLARHALLHNIFRLTRSDITISWWTGHARFAGQQPPRRLTAWKGLRRVHQEIAVVDFDELLAVPDTAPVIATLLRRTPLTQLLDSHPGAPPVHWEDAVFLLRDAELARAITHALVTPGAARDQVAGPARLAAAFEQMLERAPDEADVRAVCAFLVHLDALFCFGELSPRDWVAAQPAQVRSPLLATVLAADSASQRPRGLQTLLALPSALAQIDPQLATPPGIASSPALLARWRGHRAQTVELVSDAVIDAIAARLRRHLRPALAAGDQAPVVASD